MGCDIHGVIEAKLETYGGRVEWKMVSDIGDISTRHYGLFGYLFGVRGLCQTGCRERGLPADASWRTIYTFCEECEGKEYGKCIHCCDWHSMTYITWNELLPYLPIIRKSSDLDQEWSLVFDLMEWLANRYQGDGGRVIESTNVPALAGNEHDTSRVRMIVWFDN